MAAMRLSAIGFLLAAGGGCGNSSSSPPQCDGRGECDAQATCLNGACVDDGSVPEGQPCNQQRQCATQTTCIDGTCQPGCVDLYTTGGCAAQSFCSQVWGEIGECVASQCTPGTLGGCVEDGVCVAMSLAVGACIRGCEYGFVGSAFTDSCDPDEGLHESCQPVGFARTAACMAAGSDNGPTVGEVGCDPFVNPCQIGGICVDLVCRKLCRAGVAGICAAGEACVPYGSEFEYCLAQ